jgi:hypothetical protein
MDLSCSVFTDILSPLSAFNGLESSDSANRESVSSDSPDWNTSLVNPCNRVDSLEPRLVPEWRLDGVDADGRRYFIIPLFAIGAPPIRIDVYIPPLEDLPKDLRATLNPDAAVYTASTEAIKALPISRHIVRALEHWSSKILGFSQLYKSLPFGSQILIENITTDIGDFEIRMRALQDVEQCMMSVDALQQLWQLPGSAWPEIMDISDLQFQRQIHEAITVVTIKGCSNQDVIFKSLVRDQKHMYNELRMLLTLPPHSNLIPRPAYIVTKRCQFGGKHGICGFILEYFHHGSLGALIENTPKYENIPLRDRFRWSKQITSALAHINQQDFGFYPDLKPDNIVLKQNYSRRNPELDVILLDLEQRGGWLTWSPPEIYFVEYMDILACNLEDSALSREMIAGLKEYIPNWKVTRDGDTYEDSQGGFSLPWLALLEASRDGRIPNGLEKAQVFMLGKLIWCIFEEQSVLRCGIDHELLRDNIENFQGAKAFPEFRICPQELRQLIRDCTRGAPEWIGRRRGIIFRNGKLEPALRSNGHLENATEEETREAAKLWWTAEVHQARRFLKEISGDNLSSSSTLKMAAERPLLSEVMQELLRIEHLILS